MAANPLAIDHRRQLERAVNRARLVAEAGAGAALIALGYDDYVAPGPTAPPDCSLVGQLHVRAGQLGDGDAVRGHRPLVEEIAYERWHRMLFARFLAGNGLLRHPEGATVTLDDCEEIAREQNDGSDRWSVAVDYAVGLLPGIFRDGIPATRVVMAREVRSELEGLVVGMPDDVFTSDDGLGWVYQFWQARRKKEINDRVRSTGEKIAGADIPPVTQLFTDDYIVRFLLENTLGAWWAGKHPDSPLLAEMPYLRYAATGPTPQPPPHLDSSLRSLSDGEGEHVAEGGGLATTGGSSSPTQWEGVSLAEGEGSDPLDALADPDGIVCLPSVAGEQPAHDRLRALLAAGWGGEWSGDVLDGLLREAGSPGSDLQSWLRDDAFRQHTRLFHNRPFLWHVWDGRKDGFSAFVNYHGLDQPRLDKLIYTYLGDWITRQRERAANDVAGAPARLAAALDLQRRLELIRDGEAPYDVYVRWRGLDQQAVGWRPDLNDGVRLNIRPFVPADVLRVRFNVKWAKDRGANPDGSDVFRWSEAAQRAATPESRPAEVNGKARLNDLHLFLATKRAARGEG